METFTIRTDTVLSENFGNTLYYTLKRTEYTPATQSSPPVYNESIVIREVDDLSGPAQHFTYASCLPPVHSEFSGSCGDGTWRVDSGADSSCSDAPVWHSELRSGLGGPYYYWFDPAGGPDNWYEIALTYAHTAWMGECGTFFSTLELAETASPPLSVFPNPAGELVTISSPFTHASYRITSLPGIVAAAGEIDDSSVINISALAPGYYILTTTSGNTTVSRVLKKE